MRGQEAVVDVDADGPEERATPRSAGQAFDVLETEVRTAESVLGRGWLQKGLRLLAPDLLLLALVLGRLKRVLG
jgi:hypothetical protein